MTGHFAMECKLIKKKKCAKYPVFTQQEFCLLME